MTALARSLTWLILTLVALGAYLLAAWLAAHGDGRFMLAYSLGFMVLASWRGPLRT